jgi:preprotein translocase subunit SecA
MFGNFLKVIFGDPRDKNFKRVTPIIEQVHRWDEEFNALSDEELAAKTPEFRQRLADGQTLEDLLPEAFAAVVQACRRLCGQSWEAGGAPIQWEMVPFDVQLCGGVYLHRGFIAEMATGEGKTLVAALPLYLNALEGRGAHLVTVNDYLAKRDGEWMGKIYEKLGMTVGFILTDMTPEERRAAYNCDVTYGTNNEFGFDYLRDNMAMQKEHLVQREYHYAIVDEVDSVLIDEARTPLIISGQVDRSTHQFDTIQPMVSALVQRQTTLVNQIVGEAEKLLEEAGGDTASEAYYRAGEKLLQSRLGSPKHRRLMKVTGDGSIQRLMDRVEGDYMRDKRLHELQEPLYFAVDEKGHSIDLTEQGRATMNPDNPDLFLLTDIVDDVAAIDSREDLAPDEKERLKEEARVAHDVRSEELHNISTLLRAYILYEKDREYIVEENKVIIIDEHTGRKMAGRRWSDGLHQAVECKEGVTIEKETQTLATITLQNFFRMYAKLAGMTGTAETEAPEFAHTYGMNVSVIPTNQPVRRYDQNDLIYKTQREKYAAIVEEVRHLHEHGTPVLVGTTSIDVSEKISVMFRRAKLSHSVLNAKHHAHEAEIVAQAGQAGSITIATNMAGRGTDIKLGKGVVRCKGHKADDGEMAYCSACPNAPPDAKRDSDLPVCGLHIIGSERHDSRRIDNQLRGRSGRQGDSGASRFFLSLEDDLMRLFASERMARLLGKGFEEGEALSMGLANRAIRTAQKKIEGVNFDQRKRTLEYDDVMNKQREVIYGLRRRVLMGEGDAADLISDIVLDALPAEWSKYSQAAEEGLWDVEGFLSWVRRHVPGVQLDDLPAPTAQNEETFLRAVAERVNAAYKEKSTFFGPDLMNLLARIVLLQVIDANWRDHLLAIDELRQGIHLVQIGQKNPLTEYQREASEMFQELVETVHREIFERIYRVTIVRDESEDTARMTYLKEEGRRGIAETLRDQQARTQAEFDHARREAARQAAGENAPAPPPRPVTYRRAQPKVRPNDPCPCGSGKKYKKCCGAPGAHVPVHAHEPD